MVDSLVSLFGVVLQVAFAEIDQGYDRNAHPVQVAPRIVTKILQSGPVLFISITVCAYF